MGNSVTLPWPHPSLSPNARVHFMALARVKKAARHDAAWAAKSANLTAPDSARVKVVLTFHPKDKRPRDRDNLLAMSKAALDGIADHLCVNDSRFEHHVYVSTPDPDKLGFVIIELMEVPNA